MTVGQKPQHSWLVWSLVFSLFLATAILVGGITPIHAAPAPTEFSDDDPLQYPDAMPPIGVSVISDGLDARGHWTQIVRLTLHSGGTLADASTIVFGDFDHVNTVFDAAKKMNPHLLVPAMIPVGQEIDVQIDPSTTFALQTLLHAQDTQTWRFTNGVVDTRYQTPRGSLKRILAFPDHRPTDLFVYPSATGPLKVQPGGRIVDVGFAAGETYGDLVRQIYGLTNYATAVDLTRQTGWDPTHWPPPTGDTRRIVVGAPESYAESPPDAGFVAIADPVGQSRQRELHDRRLEVGITTARLESFGQVYHVAVRDPSVTAGDVSRLIYGSATHRLDVARAAGFQLRDATGGAADRFDPHVYGRAFDVPVDYVDERFVVRRRDSSQGVSEVDLVDGARITTYPATSSGPMLVVVYPTGYKRILYRPPTSLLTIAQGLALLNASTDLTLPAGTVDLLARQYVAHVIWKWGPGLPRTSGDDPDSVQLVEDSAGAYITVMVAPPGPGTLFERVSDGLRLFNPLYAIVALVVAGTILMVGVELARRTRGSPRRARW